MQVESDKDFPEMRKQFARWRKNFPMFKHDVSRIENIVESHVQQYSKLLVNYRQTHSKTYLEQAQVQINEINRVLSTVEKIELMAMLSR